MKKILLLILSSITGFAFADGVKYQPTDREINAIRLIFKDDIKSFINNGETAFEEDYKNNERLRSLKIRSNSCERVSSNRGRFRAGSTERPPCETGYCLCR